jgi:NAD+ kinase
LTVRPVVDTADRVFEVKLSAPNGATWVVVDGRTLHELTEQDRVVVSRAACRFKMIEVRGHSYYGTLREKLGWSGAIRNRPQR